MTLIIAEAGVNHNGDAKLAFQLVKAAAEAGADVVKFQTFKAKSLVVASAKKANYQLQQTDKDESQLQMLSQLELSYDTFKALQAYCHELNIEFLSTAFDSDSLDFLVNQLGLNYLKIPSGELTNDPLLLKHAQTGAKLIVSTGMATLAEVEHALMVIAFGYLFPDQQPNAASLLQAYTTVEGQQLLREKVSLLHCTTEYPAPFEQINLRAMDTMANAFGLTVGYSDHSQGISVAIAAVARGAKVIEKHFTLDNTMAGPDHQASLEPDELKMMVTSIRQVEQALGASIKAPQPAELANIKVARKSIVAAKDIALGEVFSDDNLAIMRPGTGMCPSQYWQLLEKCSGRAYQAGDLINE